MRLKPSIAILLIVIFAFKANAELVNVIKNNKPSIVGVGVHTPIGQPKNKLYGSGFVVADGLHVVTNYHVVNQELDEQLLQKLVVFIGSGSKTKIKLAQLVDYDIEHDLALLKVAAPALPALTLANDSFLPEGSRIAFTGFPIGAVLGLYPVTHRGIIAAITPSITPVEDSRQISLKALKRLRDPYLVYQLDATAYPGNSGSAMYEQTTGKVVGIINKVFVQQSKELVISNPSGITYAIPVKYLHKLLKKNKVE